MEPAYTTRRQAQTALEAAGLTATHKVRHGGTRHFYIAPMSRGELAVREEEISRKRAKGLSWDDQHRARMP
jgi:hypothetical protein